jgi:hypothetical protein
MAELEALGVAFVSLRDNLDLTTPSGRLMFQIIGAMAEFERALIQERVKAGLHNARAKGKSLGRPKANGRQIRRSSPARIRCLLAVDFQTATDSGGDIAPRLETRGALCLNPQSGRPWPLAISFSTSTQPRCKLDSLAPVSVRPIFPGLTL